MEKYNPKNIRVLHFASVVDKNMIQISNINIPAIANLTVLNLRQVNFAKGENNFKSLLRNNPNITTIVICMLSFIQIDANFLIILIKF
jgi:hypothetical protein